MTRLLPAALALALLAAPATLAQGQQPLLDYTLSLPTMEKCNAAMVDVMRKSASDPKLRAEQNQDDDGPDGTLEESAAYIEKKAPLFTGMMRKAGCPPLEFLKVTTAWTEAAIAQEYAASGGDLTQLPATVRKNMDFVTKNQARLNGMLSEMAAAEEALSKVGK